MRNETTKPRNEFLTSEIRLQKDSQGYFTASHKSQGFLFDWTYFETRADARRAAVEELKSLKETGSRTWEDEEDYFEDY